MTKPADDLEAVRVIAEALKDFQKDEQERIIRWAREKIGLSTLPTPAAPEGSGTPASGNATQQQSLAGATNIRTFMQQKKPKSDNQFAVAVAYYYRFEAPEDKRKSEIDGDDLIEACRLADRDRVLHPRQVLINLRNQGFLDKGSERGKYSINTVGENLVAMILPGGIQGVVRSARGKKAKKAARRR